MTSYSLQNIKELENAAEKFGFAPDYEARFARESLECEQSGLSYQRLAPNARGPFGHRHEEEEEIYVVVTGSGQAKLDDEVRDIRQWDALRVAPHTVRAFAAGPDGLELLVFGAQGLGAKDTEQIEDPWAAVAR